MAKPEARELVPWLLLGAAVYVGMKMLDSAIHSGNEQNYPAPPGQAPTLSDSILSNLAARIYAGTWSGWIFAEDEGAIIRALDQLANDADFARLATIYGTRRGPFVLDPSLNLVQSVQSALNDSEIEQVNATFAGKGMQSRF